MNGLQAVVFCLDGERHALLASAVERVVRTVEITALPGAPEGVLGVIDVGGRLLPVLDLRRRLERPPRDQAASDQLMIVDTGSCRVVLPIEEVHDIVVMDAAAVAGEALAADGLVWSHDVDRLFAPRDAAAFEQALDASREPAGEC